MGGWLTGSKTRVTVWLNALCSSSDQHTANDKHLSMLQHLKTSVRTDQWCVSLVFTSLSGCLGASGRVETAML